MAIIYSALLPEDGDVNVPLNTEVVFRAIKTDGALTLSTLQVSIFIGSLEEVAVENGVFVNDFGGEIIDNSDGNLEDITVVIIRPSIDPKYPQGQEILVGVSLS